ncbi:MAG: tRNA lysidine(34) synthetase TilS [Flavobacteriales bacterium]|nr:tRNA lysidine(34) synthetase TilS [Flavobacteriales bacterium]MDG1781790.1 tRNA lysidine(34) synthetase TilS [Flavobacteriales bacterium]MDG2246030.1 tRNA lysidine(34) synthetase TilS [Flavobacteriales bacterium]
MLLEFQQHLATTRLLGSDDFTIVACSGGPDSMALAHLLHKSGMNICLAHCNFQLRGEDSDADEALVVNWGESLGIEVHVKKFDTKSISEETNQGIQATARRLRYMWFDHLQAEIKATAIATAHHRDDQVETHLWHMMRGSSWSGFTGIPPVSGDVVRPLLFAPKEKILTYLDAQQVPFRTDKSNASADYTRNRIRNEVIPLLEDIRPGFKNNVIRQIAAFSEAGYILDQFIAELESGMLELGKDGLELNIADLKEMPFSRLLLLHILPGNGFPGRRVDEALHLIDAQVGKTIYSNSHRIIRERDSLQIRPLASIKQPGIHILEGTPEIHAPLHLIIEQSSDCSIPKMGKHLSVAFDMEQLTFPLVLRKWAHGDKMTPLGMTGSQKLSDIITQQKLTTVEKEHVYVLQSGDDILWAIGLKVSDKHKITKTTRKTFRIQCVSEI